MQLKSSSNKDENRHIVQVPIEDNYTCTMNCRICPFPGAKCSASENREIYDRVEDPFSQI